MGIQKQIKVHGENFEAALFRVEATYEDGVPLTLTVIRDDTRCELSDDPSRNQFMFAWVKAGMLQPGAFNPVGDEHKEE